MCGVAFTLHCLQFCVQGASENKENDNDFASARWIPRAIPHNSKCRYGERGAAAAKPKAQIILDAAKVSAASGGNSESKQGQRSQSARGFCPRSTMRVPQPDIIEHFGNADAVPQLPERHLELCGIALYLPPAPILPQPPHKNKTIKPSSQGAAGERAILF